MHGGPGVLECGVTLGQCSAPRCEEGARRRGDLLHSVPMRAGWERTQGELGSNVPDQARRETLDDNRTGVQEPSRN